MLDEQAKRRETCDPRNSVPVRLADGQAWLIPKPWLEVHASFDGGKAARTWPCLTYGPELDALVQAMGQCEDNAALLIGAASLGAYLLGVNYDLADAELDGLFAFRSGDPDSWNWAREVMDVATGASGPKLGSGGGT
jgi:hypothetical protein